MLLHVNLLFLRISSFFFGLSKCCIYYLADAKHPCTLTPSRPALTTAGCTTGLPSSNAHIPLPYPSSSLFPPTSLIPSAMREFVARLPVFEPTSHPCLRPSSPMLPYPSFPTTQP